MKNSIVIIILLCTPLISFAQSDEQVQQDATNEIIVEELNEESLVETEEVVDEGDIVPVEVQEPVLEEEFQDKTVGEIAQIYSIDAKIFAQKLSAYVGDNVEPETSFQILFDNYGLGSATAKDVMHNINVSEQRGDDIIIAEDVGKNKSTNTYPVAIVFLSVIIMYGLSYALVAIKKLKAIIHKKFWDIMLGISFFATVTLGIILMLNINYDITLSLPFNVLYWYIITSTFMMTLALLHFLWQKYYYKNFLRKQQSISQTNIRTTKRVM